MLALNAPKKLVARIQTLVCLVLALLCLIFSLTSSLVKIDFQDTEVINQAMSYLEEAGIDTKNDVGKLPPEINVSAVKMYGVVGTMVKLIKSATNMAKTKDTSKGAKDIMASMYGPDGKLTDGAKNSMLIAAAIATNIMNGSAKGDSKGFGAIVAMVITVLATTTLLIFSMIAPIYYLIAFLAILINVLKHLNDPENATAKVAGRLPKTIFVPIFIMMLACVTTTLTPGSGAMTLFIFVLLSALLNLVATRMHGWDKTNIKYANVIQGVSLASILGYIIYLFNIINTGVFRTFVTSDGFFKATAKAAANAASNAYNGSQIVEKQTFVPDLLMVLVAVAIVMGSYRYFSAVLRRATLSVKPKDQPGHMVYAIILMCSAVLPMVVRSLAHDTTKTPAVSYLDGMTSAQTGALTGALVGLVIILASEIALIVLKNVFCKDITEEEVHQVLTNTALSTQEKVENAKAILEREGQTVPAAEVKENKTEE